MRRDRTVIGLIVAGLLLAGCGGAGVPLGSAGAPTPSRAATPDAATDPGAALGRRGFPDACPSVAQSFEDINAATYQVFGENVSRDAQGTATLTHLPLGTAWAVGDRVLATNAHVAASYSQAAANGVALSRAIAVQSGTGTVVRLTRAMLHPDWNQDPFSSPDVALLETEQTLPQPLTLAPRDSVLALGDEVQIVGFPFDVDQYLTVVPGETVPQATSLTGRISARRAFDRTQAVTADTLAIYQHQAPTSVGTSGSSMVHCGRVAAINNAGTNRLVLTPDSSGDGVTVDRQSAAANNFGIHVRYIHQLVEAFDRGAAGAFDLPVPVGAVATAAPPASQPPIAASQPPGPPPVAATQPGVAVTPGSGSPTVAGGFAVRIVNFGFEPPDVSGSVGGTVTWTNTGDVAHTVTAEEVAFDSGPIEPGQSITATFPTAGLFRYFCAIHPSMRGLLTVVADTPPVSQGSALVGRYTGSVADPTASHSFAFLVAENGTIQGTTIWPNTGEFQLAGTVNPDGTFQMTDDAPERRGFRRGIYQGAIAADGSISGVYFEQTREDEPRPFTGGRES